VRDRPQSAALHGGLARLRDRPDVELNRAVAVAEVDGPQAAPAVVDRLAPEEHRVPARRAGRAAGAPRTHG